MDTDKDFKELWNKQPVPAMDRSEVLKKTDHYKRAELKKKTVLNILLLLIVLFIFIIGFCCNSLVVTTKAGIILSVLPILMAVFFNSKMIPLYKVCDESQSNLDYLNNLLLIKKREKTMQTRVMGFYFILLSIGIGLYMYEFTFMKSVTWGTIAYVIWVLWVALNWFIFRPKVIKKNNLRITILIQQLEKLQSQINN